MAKYLQWKGHSRYGKIRVPFGMVVEQLKDKFSMVATLIEDPIVGLLEEPLIASLHIRGATGGEGYILAFLKQAHFAWENLLAGDKIAMEGRIFKTVRKRYRTSFYRANELVLRAMKITLLESKGDGPERDAAIIARTLNFRPLAPDGTGRRI